MHLARYQDTVATAQALLEHGIEWTPALARDFERAHQWSLEHQGRAIPPGSRTRTREMKAWARAVRSLIKRRQERSVSPEMVERTLDYINESLQQLLGLRNYHFYQTARGKFTTMVQAAIRRSP